MILAKCPNTECLEHGNEYLVDDQTPRVECGSCGRDCDLADPEIGFIEPEPATQTEQYNYDPLEEPTE